MRAGLRDPGFRPVRIIEVELTDPLPSLTGDGPVRLLVRTGGRPVGFVPATVPPGGLRPEQVRELLARPPERTRPHLLGSPDRADRPAGRAGEPAGRTADPREPQPDPLEPLPDPLDPASSLLSTVPARGTTADPGLPAGSRPTVTVVVPTCAAGPELLRTLDGLRAQTMPPDEIITVDNRPGTSGVRWLLETAGVTDVTLIEEPRRGVSPARNAGLVRAHGEIVAFTDDDVTVDPGWLAALVGGFTDDQVACVTGLILPLELETPAQCWLEEYGGYAKGFHRRRFDLAEHRGDGDLYPYAAGVFGTGANAAFRTDVLRALGGFDEHLGSGTPARGGEDLDIYLTVIRSGRALVYEPGALVRHAHHRNTADLRRQMYGYGVGLTAMLAKRWANGPEERRELLSRALVGARHLIHPASPKNRGKSRSYPVSLTLIEFAGLVRGPFAYWRSRRAW